MKKELKNYLTSKFSENGIKINLRKLTETELFYYLLLFKEGMDIPIEVATIFFNYAKKIIDVADIKKRVLELKKGDIGLDDFTSGAEMAEYLENGDFS